MDPLKSSTPLHDVKKRCFPADPWWMARGELLAWTLAVVLLPALALAWRSAGPRASAEVLVWTPAAAAPTPIGASPARLDLNRASAAQLELLPGIGPSRAQKILERRAQKGPFKSIYDLTEIRGISRRMAEKLEPLVTAEP